MTARISFTTLTTTLPTNDDERYRLIQHVGERDQQLYDYGRAGYRHASTVTVTGSALVTVIDTLTKEVQE